MTLRPTLLAALGAALMAPALAAAGEPAAPAQLEVLPGWRTQEGTQVAALRLRLAPGWKTYWRSPGDTGIPPSFDWRGSRNLGAVQIHWPRPGVYVTDGLRTIGYADELILPLTLSPRARGPVTLAGRVEIGVCREVCIPMTLRFRAKLPQTDGPDPRIEAAMARAPVPLPATQVDSLRCEVAPLADGLRLTARMRLPSLGDGELAIVEHADPTIWVSEARTDRSGPRLRVTADMVPLAAAPFALDRSRVILSLLGATGAVEIHGCPAG